MAWGSHSSACTNLRSLRSARVLTGLYSAFSNPVLERLGCGMANMRLISRDAGRLDTCFAAALMAAPVCCYAGRPADAQWAADGLRRSFRPGGSTTELDSIRWKSKCFNSGVGGAPRTSENSPAITMLRRRSCIAPGRVVERVNNLQTVPSRSLTRAGQCFRETALLFPLPRDRRLVSEMPVQ